MKKSEEDAIDGCDPQGNHGARVGLWSQTDDNTREKGGAVREGNGRMDVTKILYMHV